MAAGSAPTSHLHVGSGAEWRRDLGPPVVSRSPAAVGRLPPTAAAVACHHRRRRGYGGVGGEGSCLLRDHDAPPSRPFSRRTRSVDTGTMSPSTTPQPRFSARPPQGVSCQVWLLQGWVAVCPIPCRWS